MNEAVVLLNNIISSAFNNCFPLIEVKLSTRDPPYMSHLVKLCAKYVTKIYGKESMNNYKTKLIYLSAKIW